MARNEWKWGGVTTTIVSGSRIYKEVVQVVEREETREKYMKLQKIREETKVGVRLTKTVFIMKRGDAFGCQSFRLVEIIPPTKLYLTDREFYSFYKGTPIRLPDGYKFKFYENAFECWHHNTILQDPKQVKVLLKTNFDKFLRAITNLDPPSATTTSFKYGSAVQTISPFSDSDSEYESDSDETGSESDETGPDSHEPASGSEEPGSDSDELSPYSDESVSDSDTFEEQNESPMMQNEEQVSNIDGDTDDEDLCESDSSSISVEEQSQDDIYLDSSDEDDCSSEDEKQCEGNERHEEQEEANLHHSIIDEDSFPSLFTLFPSFEDQEEVQDTSEDDRELKQNYSESLEELTEDDINKQDISPSGSDNELIRQCDAEAQFENQLSEEALEISDAEWELGQQLSEVFIDDEVSKESHEISEQDIYFSEDENELIQHCNEVLIDDQLREEDFEISDAEWELRQHLSEVLIEDEVNEDLQEITEHGIEPSQHSLDALTEDIFNEECRDISVDKIKSKPQQCIPVHTEEQVNHRTEKASVADQDSENRKEVLEDREQKINKTTNINNTMGWIGSMAVKIAVKGYLISSGFLF